MPGFVLNKGATLLCPHGGQVQITPGNMRVKVGGQPVATMADQFLISGCPFMLPNGKPQPCVRIQWMVGAARVQATHQPVILNSSSGLCLSAEGIPAGPPTVVQAQARVRGT